MDNAVCYVLKSDLDFEYILKTEIEDNKKKIDLLNDKNIQCDILYHELSEHFFNYYFKLKYFTDKFSYFATVIKYFGNIYFLEIKGHSFMLDNFIKQFDYDTLNYTVLNKRQMQTYADRYILKRKNKQLKQTVKELKDKLKN